MTTNQLALAGLDVPAVHLLVVEVNLRIAQILSAEPGHVRTEAGAPQSG